MIRVEYDEVVAYHPYRTYQPWNHGGVRLLHIDGVNGPPEDRSAVAAELRFLEQRLIQDARAAGITAQEDNHYGFTVRLDVSGGESPWPLPVYNHLRFSDGSLYVWLMPGPPDMPAAGSLLPLTELSIVYTELRAVDCSRPGDERVERAVKELTRMRGRITELEAQVERLEDSERDLLEQLHEVGS